MAQLIHMIGFESQLVHNNRNALTWLTRLGTSAHTSEPKELIEIAGTHRSDGGEPEGPPIQ
jgi:hypothetical protein